MPDFSFITSSNFYSILAIVEIVVPTIIYVCTVLILGIYKFRSPFRLLTILFVFGSLMLTIIMLKPDLATQDSEIFAFADMVGTLIMFPLAFGFLFEWIYPKWLSGKRIVICFLAPVILSFLLILSYIFSPKLQPLMNWDDVISNIRHPEVWIRLTAFVAVIAELFIFPYMLFKYEKRHRVSIKNNFSFTEGTNLRWVRIIAIQLILYGISLVLRDFFVLKEMKFLVGLTLATLPLTVCIFSIRQQELYFKTEEEEEDLLPLEAVIQTHTSKKREQLKTQLLILLEKDEVFRDPNLSIETMYKMLNTNRTYLSNLINQEMGLSFYQLVNSYRIKKAAELLQSEENSTITIRDIATIVGFKSMSTFNILFKDEYNILPSAWRKGGYKYSTPK